mgnify:CR=1 FL=1
MNGRSQIRGIFAEAFWRNAEVSQVSRCLLLTMLILVPAGSPLEFILRRGLCHDLAVEFGLQCIAETGFGTPFRADKEREDFAQHVRVVELVHRQGRRRIGFL